MRILLTGATGFLGTSLLDYFLRHNHEVLIIKRATTDLSQLYQRFGNIEALNSDNLSYIAAIHPKIDLIVHAATDYGHNSTIPTSVFWANEAFPIGLLELAISQKINFFNIDTFFNSKKTKYGYLGSYTLSKRHFQEWGEHCANVGKIKFFNFKLFHLYGPGDNFNKFVPTIVQRCLMGEEINLTDGIQARDFIYISDAVDAVGAILESIEMQKPKYHNYDVGTGVSTSIREFVEMVKRFSSSSSKLNFGVLPNRMGEIQNIVARTENLRSLGWRPRIGIEAGIKNIIKDIDRRK